MGRRFVSALIRGLGLVIVWPIALLAGAVIMLVVQVLYAIAALAALGMFGFLLAAEFAREDHHGSAMWHWLEYAGVGALVAGLIVVPSVMWEAHRQRRPRLAPERPTMQRDRPLAVSDLVAHWRPPRSRPPAAPGRLSSHSIY